MSITFQRFQEDYTKKSSLLVKRYNDLKTNIQIDREDEERYLDLLIYEVHAQAQKRIWRFKGVSMVEQDEERQRLTEAMEEMTLQKYDTFSMIWNEVKKVFENWKSAIAHRKKTNRLHNKDNKMRKLILSQKIETVQKERIIRKLRKRLSETELTNLTTNTGIEVAQYQRDFKQFKKDVQSEKVKDDEDLNHLVAQSYAVEKRLLEIREKAEKVLRLLNLCNPFETKSEKGYLPRESSLALDVSPNSEELMKFWTKVSHIDAIRYKLKEEKQRLEEDNYLMKNFIRSKFIGKHKHFIQPKIIEM